MSYTNEELKNMLEDVVNELDLSQDMIKKHGQEGTPPAVLVREVLARKDREIQMLKQGMVPIKAQDIKRAVVHTRQNSKGNYWCNGTINGSDQSFEGWSIECAQAKMRMYLNCKGIRNIIWEAPVEYVPDPPKPNSPVDSRRSRLDHL